MTAHEEAVQRHARVLKAMLWGMGVLMAAAALVVGIMVYRFMHCYDCGSGGINTMMPLPWGVSVPAPPGCVVAQVTTSADRLIVSMTGGDLCRKVTVIDMKSWREIGQVDFPTPQDGQ